MTPPTHQIPAWASPRPVEMPVIWRGWRDAALLLGGILAAEVIACWIGHLAVSLVARWATGG